jgi:hypothetical protein
MDFGWAALALLCVAAAIAWFWQDSLAARERANAAAMEACERLALQLLDGTVAFARLSVTRGPRGSLSLRRTYVFDYTANSIERRQGFVVLLGRRIESVGYASEPAAKQQSAEASIQPIDAPVTPAANVFDMAHWRSQRRQRIDTQVAPRSQRSDRTS